MKGIDLLCLIKVIEIIMLNQGEMQQHVCPFQSCTAFYVAMPGIVSSLEITCAIAPGCSFAEDSGRRERTSTEASDSEITTGGSNDL